MRVLSRIVFWIGLAAIVGACVYYGVQPGFQTWSQYNALTVGRSAPFPNPLYGTGIAAAILLAGGFLVGLGIGMIRKKKPPVAPNAPAAAPTDPVSE